MGQHGFGGDGLAGLLNGRYLLLAHCPINGRQIGGALDDGWLMLRLLEQLQPTLKLLFGCFVVAGGLRLATSVR